MEFQIDLLDTPCGILSIEQERFSFTYLHSYLSAKAPPISVAMPLRKEPYGDNQVFPFFENLLPEGQIRQLMAEKLKTAENNFSRLLENAGGDVAGALKISPAQAQQPVTKNLSPQRLTKRKLGEVLARIEISPFLIDQEEKLRLSLAGAQNKLPVIMQDKKIYLTNGQPSTHIVKPPSPRFEYLVENEYLCMTSARKAGLNTPAVELIPFVNANGEEHECLVIERYDREIVESTTHRIHQEDLCQILAIPSSQKYAKDGGPGYQELFDSVRRYTSPSALYQNELIKRVLFNILLGNNDAHGKNFSLLHTIDKTELSPVYDLVATEIYDDLDQRFAMPFGDATTKKELNDKNLAMFEEQTQVSLKRQKTILLEFVNKAADSITSEIQSLGNAGFPSIDRLLTPMSKLVSRNRSILLELLA